MNSLIPTLPALGLHTDHVRRLFLRNLRVQASIGIHLPEMMRKQTILVNIDLFVDANFKALSDDIATVLDYDFVREGIRQLTTTRHFNLQETLCEEIMALCLSRREVVAARVSTEKLEAYADCDAVGCEIFRHRHADI